jgi:hypothetical protein
MRPSRFPAGDDWSVREEDEHATCVAVVIERRQDRCKGARGKGAPEDVCDFVHGDATEEKLTLRRTSAEIGSSYHVAALSLANFRIQRALTTLDPDACLNSRDVLDLNDGAAEQIGVSSLAQQSSVSDIRIMLRQTH